METLTNIDKIKEYFPNHTKTNVKTFISIVVCILKLRTTCIYKFKDKMAEVTGKKKTQAMSHYKTIIRFFKLENAMDFCDGIFKLVSTMFKIESNRIVIDRSNWKIGKKNINLLTVGVLFFNCFIPLCWQQLDKRGNSHFKERRTLMNRFIRLWRMAGKKIKDMTVIADREFIGHDWLFYLNENHLFYVFRLRDNMYFELFGNLLKRKRQLRSFAGLIEKNGMHWLEMSKDGVIYTIVMTKNLKQDRNEPYIFFISNIANAYEILKHYTNRWKIESCFRHLKSNGFDLEAMNLKQDQKIELMMGLVVTAYAVAVLEGMLAYLRKPFKKKNYKNGKIYNEISIFRKGTEITDQIILNGLSLLKTLIKAIRYSLKNPYVDYVLVKNVQ